MSDVSDDTPPFDIDPIEPISASAESPPEEKVKKKKGKKPPSDFEVVRTILQRTHERKLPYILKNMGEDENLLFLCSTKEEDFAYGSSNISIAIVDIIDPTLKEKVESVLKKMYGFKDPTDQQMAINIRDQISELAKTKGESMEVEVKTNLAGSVWVSRTDVRGQERIINFVLAVDSLYHFEMVKTWSDKYKHLLHTDNPDYLYYPYTYEESSTTTIVKFTSDDMSDTIIRSLYPDGFRCTITKGVDVLTSKGLAALPFPIIQEEVIIFNDTSNGRNVFCQMAHRIQAEGWKMIILRPNSIFFPSLAKDIASN